MPAPPEALQHYRQRQALARRTSEQAMRAWREVQAADLAGSWATVAPDVARLVIPAQIASASTADAYVEALADGAPTAGGVQPRGFAGAASDGRPLISLLEQPVFHVKRALAAGETMDAALAVGRRSLGMIVGTQVQDAGRAADGVAITVRNGMGYVRMLSTPSCSRCAVLAGRFYRWHAGFQRHPRCDCQHIPSTFDGAREHIFDTDRYFSGLGAAEQDRIFTKAGAEAIRDGADIGQVVNARLGMTPAGTTYTGSGRGRRRHAGRLMPERIYAEAGGDRQRAIELLRSNGFVT